MIIRGVRIVLLAAAAALALSKSDVSLGNPLQVTHISVGGAHTCAVTQEGGVTCWGVNSSGQLGNGALTTREYTPVDVLDGASGKNLSDVTEIGAGAASTCALTAGGGVKCWGANFNGQLGNGTTDDALMAVGVAGLTSEVIDMDVGGDHACAVTAEADLYCWGSNDLGELGITANDRCFAFGGEAPCSKDPLEVTDVRGEIARVSAGPSKTCALMKDTSVRCWGYNDEMQLGVPITSTCMQFDIPADCTPLPKPVCASFDASLQECTQAFTGAQSVSAGSDHSCAVVTGARAKCWGRSFSGELGDGFQCGAQLPFTCPTPVSVCKRFDHAQDYCSEELSRVESVSAGNSNTCILLLSGEPMCWGSEGDSQLLGDGLGGDGTNCPTPCSTPISVCSGDYPQPCQTKLTEIAEVEVAGTHACAVARSHKALCWGGNFYGQLGNGMCCDDWPVPTDVVAVQRKLALGDIDCAGGLTALDAQLLLQYDAGLIRQFGLVFRFLPCFDIADANQDEQIDSMDAHVVLVAVAGL